MAQIITSVSEAVYQIKKWLGVNEALEGEASLKMGEAALMRNFKVTAGGALKKRAGSRNIAGLMSGYTAEVDTGTTSVLLTETGQSTAALTMYPGIEVDSVGGITLTGESAEVTNENQAEHLGWYYRAGDGAVYKFTGVTA
ncbi:MAG: hypothetical protein U0M31_01290 [Oscillospiraceae bacterium]|nr:hypothetical protein [Oscillospiraceae bacterium]